MSYTTHRPPPTRRRGSSYPAAAIALAIPLLLLAVWANSCLTNRARRDCAARGGYFTQIVTSRHTGWSCTIPPRIGGVDR